MGSKGIVVKIGGSLMDTAGIVLQEIAKSKVSPLLVPGGGMFADEVRAANLDDDTAHWNAIRSMNRYGRFLSTYGYKLTETPEIPDTGIEILLPEKIMKEEDPLPHSWEVTSDSIALWLAERLQVPLLLVKSRNGTPDGDLVDTYFPVLQKRTSTQIYLANGRSHGDTQEVLSRIVATLL